MSLCRWNRKIAVMPLPFLAVDLSLTVLIETMRHEGFELEIGPPEVIIKTGDDGKKQEPYDGGSPGPRRVRFPMLLTLPRVR